jgi:thiamine-monophosphate kinase
VKPLSSAGEFSFIEAIHRIALSGDGRGVVLGIGDDAACIRIAGDAVVSVDAVVENVHYRPEWLSPRELGRRAFRAAVSDLSASGSDPRFVLLALTLRTERRVDEALGFVKGLVRDASAVGATLVGGNVSAAPVFSATLTVIGRRGKKLLRRDAARPRDAVYVTGTLGGGAAGVALLERGEHRGALQTAFRCPPLRIAAGRALARFAAVGAVIDVSDGLVQDLAHVCDASRVSAEIDVDAVPLPTALRKRSRGSTSATDARRYALFGGDDYELLFTVRPGAKRAKAIVAALARAGCACRRIGRIVERGSVAVRDAADGNPLRGGYSHFGLEGPR